MKRTVSLPAGNTLTVAAGSRAVHAMQTQDASIAATIAAYGSTTFGPYPLTRTFEVTGDNFSTSVTEYSPIGGLLDTSVLSGTIGDPISITTGASPVDVELDPNVRGLIIHVTSGGTAGNEVLNIPYPQVDEEYFNAAYIGYRITIKFVTQTNAADRVALTGDNFNQFNYGTAALPYQLTPLKGGSNITLNARQFVSFIWDGGEWKVDLAFATAFFSATDLLQKVSIGGNTSLDVDILARRVLLHNLPTSDPGVADALWNNAGTLKVSAG